MSGDRFFFTHKNSGIQKEKGLPLEIKKTIRNRTLGDIICDNTDASETRRRVMEMSATNDIISCSKSNRLDFDAIVEELMPPRQKYLMYSWATMWSGGM